MVSIGVFRNAFEGFAVCSAMIRLIRSRVLMISFPLDLDVGGVAAEPTRGLVNQRIACSVARSGVALRCGIDVGCGIPPQPVPTIRTMGLLHEANHVEDGVARLYVSTRPADEDGNGVVTLKATANSFSAVRCATSSDSAKYRRVRIFLAVFRAPAGAELLGGSTASVSGSAPLRIGDQAPVT